MHIKKSILFALLAVAVLGLGIGVQAQTADRATLIAQITQQIAQLKVQLAELLGQQGNTNPSIPIPPSITVVSPNGGETYSAIDTITIRWESTGGDVVIAYLVDNNGNNCFVNKNGSDIGKLSFIPSVMCPDTLKSSGKYKIVLKLHTSGVVVSSDESNKFFTINNNTTKIDNAACVTDTIPSTLTPGQAFTATVTVKNTGTTAWVGNNYRLRNDGYATWGLTNSSYTWAGWPTMPVNPSTHITIDVKGVAPTTAGTYPFKVHMTQNGVADFGETCGRTITVAPATTTQCPAGTQPVIVGQTNSIPPSPIYECQPIEFGLPPVSLESISKQLASIADAISALLGR